MFTVYDLETTGFSSASDDVIQFAYATFDDNNQFIKADTLYFFYEGMSWSESAYEVHQIPLEFLAQYKDQFEENVIKMFTVLSGANVSGHNCMSFDCPFAVTWLKRQGLPQLQFGIIQDTMNAFRPFMGGHKAKLAKLAERVGVTPNVVQSCMNMWFPNEDDRRAHNAAYDVTLTALITLRGLAKGYMNFTTVPNIDSVVDSVDMDLLGNNEAPQLPAEERVYFDVRQLDGSTAQIQFVSDRDAFSNVTSVLPDSVRFPVILLEEVEGVYSGDHGSATFQLKHTKYGDMFSITVGDNKLETPTLGLKTFTVGLSRKE